MTTERIAIIDLGSNSARLIIMHIYENGGSNLVYHQKETVRLSEGVKDGYLREEAMNRALEAMAIIAHMCQLMKVDSVLAVTTAAVRNARNGPEFLEQICQKTGIPLQAISSDEEARLGYIGVINTLDITDAVLFDLGGASTELTLIKNRKLKKTFSLPFGAINLTEAFGTQDVISDSQLTELQTFIIKKLSNIPWLKDLSLPFVGVGGTARNIAKMEQRRKNYPFNKVHNYHLGKISVNDLWHTLSAINLKQRRSFPGLSSERADIIVAGTTIVKCLFDITRSDQLIISGCGVREGLFLQHLLARKGYPDVIADPLLHSTQNMLFYCKGDIAHSNHVADLAEKMFDGWRQLHNLEERDKQLLKVASLLHDIGITINYYGHTRHSAYLVENARLFGLTHREQMLTAVVVSWHHGSSAKYVRNHLYSEFLDEADWNKARKMALLLALAESLDSTQMQIVKKVNVTHDLPAAYLTIDIDEQEGLIELKNLQKHSKWFKKEFGKQLTCVINNRKGSEKNE